MAKHNEADIKINNNGIIRKGPFLRDSAGVWHHKANRDAVGEAEISFYAETACSIAFGPAGTPNAFGVPWINLPAGATMSLPVDFSITAVGATTTLTVGPYKIGTVLNENENEIVYAIRKQVSETEDGELKPFNDDSYDIVF